MSAPHPSFLKTQIVTRFFSRTVEYNIGTRFENVLGLQVARLLFGNIGYNLMARSGVNTKNRDVEELDRNGVLVIQDFLSPSDFTAVMEEFDKTRQIHQAALAPLKDGGMFRKADFDVGHNASASFPVICSKLQNNDRLNAIVSAAARRRLTTIPSLRLITVERTHESGVHNDNQQTLHADLHLPTFKAFYYLNDVGAGDGPFVYARGSHLVRWGRIKYEYADSVARHDVGYDEFPAHVIEVHAPKMGLKPTELHAPANTLIIANNMGFHARGPFSPGRRRETIEVGYREAFLSRLPRRLLNAVRHSS